MGTLNALVADPGVLPKLREHAALAVGMIGEKPDTPLHDALRTAYRPMWIGVAQGAGLLGDAAATPRLLEILQSGEESQYILWATANGLGRLADDRTAAELAKIADTMGETPSAVRSFRAMSSSFSKSRLAWTVAVRCIMCSGNSPRVGRYSRMIR